MIILPAIDIQDGTCVRLVKGDFATSHKVAEDYRKTAAGFVAAGASCIRSLDTVEAYLKGGISRVILGSIALKNPQIVKDAVKEYGERIAVGIDAKNGMVAVEGWLDSSSVDYLSLAKEMAAVGVQYIIYTDISRDGTLSGVNTEQLQQIHQAVGAGCNIIASGGVHTIADIQACKQMGLYGTICGKSLYQGTLQLEDAIACAGAQV